MSDVLLVLNAGSSSLKFSVFEEKDAPEELLRGLIEELSEHPKFTARRSGKVVDRHEWPERTNLGHRGAIAFLLDWLRKHPLAGELVAAGHRVVHGGTRFRGPVLVDPSTLAALKDLIPLAPLHQPHNIAVIEAVVEAAPKLPQVACFDTAFHRTQPAVAQAFALPRRYSEEGIHRYGFHGLSYEFIASRLPEIDPRAAAGRTVVAHLGNGASLCAMAGGSSVATTMGLTALDGLMMGTRAGALDPGVLLYLMERHRMDAPALSKLLYEESGLLGVSGVSSDMRELLASADPRAAEAVDLFVYRIVRELGSLAAALGGLDALVFTGGIGENAAPVRERVCGDAEWLGIRLDPAANGSGQPRISRDDSPVAVWVVPTNEELVIARHTRKMRSAPPRN
jgi:acetate kinase